MVSRQELLPDSGPFQPAEGVWKQKGRGEGKVEPKSWDQMSSYEKWWLQDLWAGRLRREMDEAEGGRNRVQAERFP